MSIGTPTSRQRWSRIISAAPALLSVALTLAFFVCLVIATVKFAVATGHEGDLHLRDFRESIRYLGFAVLLMFAETVLDVTITRRRRQRPIRLGGQVGTGRVGFGRTSDPDWTEVTAADLNVGDYIQLGRLWSAVSAKGPAPDSPNLIAIWAGAVEPIVCLGPTVFMAQTADSRRAAMRRWAAGTDRLTGGLGQPETAA